jgi:hypothetical protein
MKINGFKYFFPERPKLIHPDQVEQLEGGEWVAEKKWNGSRLLLHRDPFGAWFLKKYPIAELVKIISGG